MWSWIKGDIATIAALALGVLLGLQTWRLHTEQLRYSTLETRVAKDNAARASASLKQIEKNVAKKETHATASTENASELLQNLERRAAAATRRAADADRLRLDAERRAATYRAMSESGGADCSALADRTAALDRSLAKGLGVVAELQGTVERRDAEVAALMRQIQADRALMSEP
ncbi:MAG: hypothetical protein WC322_00265 [Candidatus Paceibacterota bacterium]|jgi:ABC-type transporter Mla subunit MlaD